MRGCAAEELRAEDQARTGEAGLGFLEFGDVERRDLEAAGFDVRARAREGRGEDDGVGEGQSVGSVWFGGIDVDPIVTGERRCIEPRAIGEKRIAA